MKNQILERIWKSRESISRNCEFDSQKLVRFYQSLQKSQNDRTKQCRLKNATHF